MAFYMVKAFARFARRQRISNASLVVAAIRVVTGSADADLGGGLWKQRVPRQGGGKSGGFRTLLAHRAGGHVFFLHGFAKNAQGSIDDRETRALQALGKLLHGLEAEHIRTALDTGELLELNDDGRK